MHGREASFLFLHATERENASTNRAGRNERGTGSAVAIYILKYVYTALVNIEAIHPFRKGTTTTTVVVTYIDHWYTYVEATYCL